MTARKILDITLFAGGASFVLGRLGFFGWNKVPVESYKDLLTATAEKKNLVVCDRVTINRYYIDDEAATYEHLYYIRPVILLDRYYDKFYTRKS